MAVERSPYEGSFDMRLHSQTCLGRVVGVDVPSRTCRIKTIGIKGRTDDLDLYYVQWLSAVASSDGTEDLCIPRIGSVGVVVFVNSQPFIVGYLKPVITPDAAPATVSLDESLISAGDRGMSTAGGNHIILRAGATIEVAATDSCRTYWIPSNNYLYSVCGDFGLETDGGYEFWSRDLTTGDTVLERLSWDNLEPSTAVYTQEGATDTGAIYRQSAGPLDSDGNVSAPNYDNIIDASGRQIEKIALVDVQQVGTDTSSYLTTKDVENNQANFSTPSGHRIVIDDTKDGGTISVIHRSGATFQITQTGDIKLQTQAGQVLELATDHIGITTKNGSNVTVGDSISICDQSGGQLINVTNSGDINVTASANVIVSAPSVQIQGATIDLGNNPSFHAVIYENLKAIFDSHIHATPVGPSGPPIPPNTMGLMELNPTASAKAENVKVRGNLTP